MSWRMRELESYRVCLIEKRRGSVDSSQHQRRRITRLVSTGKIGPNKCDRKTERKTFQQLVSSKQKVLGG